MNKLIGRDPVLTAQFVVGALLALSLLLNLSTDVQALVNAAVVAVGGVIAAWLVAAESAVPLLDGAAKAVLALVVGLGVDVPANVQAGVFALLALISSYWMRTQVVAPVKLATVADTPPPITRTTGGHV